MSNTVRPHVDHYEFVERSAILEYYAGFSKEEADKRAWKELTEEPKKQRGLFDDDRETTA